MNALHFRSIGPTQQSGRFVDFAVPSGKPNTFYAASASGGLWKTENNGQTFEPLFEHEKVFSIGDIAVAPSDPAILWLGSGEANNSRSTYWGDGVYKSVDAGKTWLNMGLRESHHIGRILIHPSDPNVVYVAALGHLYTENAERGLYKTTDGGKTWAKVLDIAVDGRAVGVVDVVMDPTAPETLYAAAYDKFRKPWTWGIGGPGSGIHKTTDGGKTWTKLTAGLPGGILGRIGLTVFPKNPKILYAEIENANKPGMSAEDRWKEVLAGKSSSGMIDGEIYRSDDAGATWTKVSPEKRSIGGDPGYYYGQIIVDPNDAEPRLHPERRRPGQQGRREDLDARRSASAATTTPSGSIPRTAGTCSSATTTAWASPGTAGRTGTIPISCLWPSSTPSISTCPIPTASPAGCRTTATSWARAPTWAAGGGFGGRAAAGPPIRLEDWFGMGGGDGMYNVFDRATNRTLYNESQFGPAVPRRPRDRRGQEHRLPAAEARDALELVRADPRLGPRQRHGLSLRQHRRHVDQPRRILDRDQPRSLDQRLRPSSRSRAREETATSSTARSRPSTNRRSSPACFGPAPTTGMSGSPATTARTWVKLNDKITGNPGYWVSRVAASPSDPGTAYVSYTGFRNDDFRPYRLQDDRLRRHLDLPGRGTRRGTGQRRPRGPQEPQGLCSPGPISASMSPSTAARPG